MNDTRGSNKGIALFFLALIVLALLRVVLSFILVPLAWVPFANLVMNEIFLGVPLLALCLAARDQWTPKTALFFLASGLFLQVSCVVLTRTFFREPGVSHLVLEAIGQIGLPMWCVGLGALLATLIKDQNLLVPIAIFLAFLDLFLVFSPVGVTHKVLRQMPGVLPAIGAAIPAASTSASQKGKVIAAAFAGPADFMFLAMFMVALFRFNMKARRTVLVVVPTLLAYMILVDLLHLALPALVPIGICVLIVNWKEFRLTRDEKISTALVACLGIGLFTWGMMQKPKVVQVDSSQQAVESGVQESAESR